MLAGVLRCVSEGTTCPPVCVFMHKSVALCCVALVCVALCGTLGSASDEGVICPGE